MTYYRAFGLSEIETERRVEGGLKDDPCPYLLGQTPRVAMQTLGTEWGRDCIHNDIWTQVAMSQAERSIEDGTPVVITDARFPNEFEAVEAVFPLAAFVYIERPGIQPMTHVSEQYVQGREYDIRITNEDTIEALVLTLQASLEDFELTMTGTEPWPEEEE